MTKRNEVLVGVGVVVIRNGHVLLGERQGSHGSGTWALPGGHLEFGESIEECAQREVMEETGLTISGIRNLAFTNDIFEVEGKHYVTLFVAAESCDGEPLVMEPSKCKGWSWFEWASLPSPLFTPLENLKKQGFMLPIEV